MKILVIASNVGRTTPGIVFERLIKGLSSYHQVDVLTSDFNTSLEFCGITNTIISKSVNLPPLIYKPMISILGFNPLDLLWAWKSIKYVRRRTKQEYDVVLSFLSNHHYAAIITGSEYSKMFKCKFAVHSLDAIPARGWPDSKRYYENVEKLIDKYLSSAHAFFSTNEQMLKYQLTTFRNRQDLISDIIYNPHLGKLEEFLITNSDVNNFVYTGKLYGVRRGVYLLTAFEKLLSTYPASKLIFVEGIIDKRTLSKFKISTLKRIEFVPFVNNLSPYYSCATALIDIDADIPNDLFISSKIINYLMINRIIISETGLNSPSYHLFHGIESIFQVDHDPDQICEAMQRAIVLRSKISFDDRNSVRTLFSLENVTNKLNNSLQKLVFSCIN